MFLKDRPLLNLGQPQVAGLWGASSATPPRGWGAKMQASARKEDPHVPPHSFVPRSEGHGGREARLRRWGQSAVTLRAEDPGPCARRETKATTKEVAAAGGGGGSFLSNRSTQPPEKGDSTWPLGVGGESS